MKILYTGSLDECDLRKVHLDLQGIRCVVTNAIGNGGYSYPELRVQDEDLNAAIKLLQAFQVAKGEGPPNQLNTERRTRPLLRNIRGDEMIGKQERSRAKR